MTRQGRQNVEAPMVCQVDASLFRSLIKPSEPHANRAIREVRGWLDAYRHRRTMSYIYALSLGTTNMPVPSRSRPCSYTGIAPGIRGLARERRAPDFACLALQPGNHYGKQMHLNIVRLCRYRPVDLLQMPAATVRSVAVRQRPAAPVAVPPRNVAMPYTPWMCAAKNSMVLARASFDAASS